jgi:hypothetical protein
MGSSDYRFGARNCWCSLAAAAPVGCHLGAGAGSITFSVSLSVCLSVCVSPLFGSPFHGLKYAGNLVDSYLKLGDFNVFSIDWSDLENWNYFVARKRRDPCRRAGGFACGRGERGRG